MTLVYIVDNTVTESRSCQPPPYCRTIEHACPLFPLFSESLACAATIEIECRCTGDCGKPGFQQKRKLEKNDEAPAVPLPAAGSPMQLSGRTHSRIRAVLVSSAVLGSGSRLGHVAHMRVRDAHSTQRTGRQT